LTQAARDAADKARDADIAQRKAAGQSNRAIARDIEVDEKTVRNVLGADKVKPLVSPQPPAEPLPQHPAQAEKSEPIEPKPKHPAQLEFDDMVSPRGKAWGALLFALREFNKLASSDVLFADRYRRLDEAASDRKPALNGRGKAGEHAARVTDRPERTFGNVAGSLSG
jgi:hypothetical protein